MDQDDRDRKEWTEDRGRSRFKIFPAQGRTMTRGEGFYFGQNVIRAGEGSFKAMWPRPAALDLADKKAKLAVVLEEIIGAQAKALPDLERKRDGLEQSRDRLVHQRRLAAQNLLDKIDLKDRERLLKSRKAHDAMASGDPDAMTVCIQDHLRALYGKATKGDLAACMGKHTQEHSRLVDGTDLPEYLAAVRDRIYASDVLMQRMPGDLSQAQQEFIFQHNEGLLRFLSTQHLDEETQAHLRKFEGGIDPDRLQALEYDEYVARFTSFVQNERPLMSSRKAFSGTTQLNTPREERAGRRDLATVRCFKCRKFGHYRSDCEQESSDDSDDAAQLGVAELKMLRRLLRNAGAGAGAETKAEPRARFAAAAVVRPALSDQEEDSDDAGP